MNLSKSIDATIYKNPLWMYLHLASTILITSLIYTSLRLLTLPFHISIIIATIVVLIDLVISYIKFSLPNQAEERLYWATTYIYQVVVILMLIVSIWNLMLLFMWLGILLLIWSIFIIVIFMQAYEAANFGRKLQHEMEREQIPPRDIALLTGVDESRILKFSTGKENPSKKEAETLVFFLDSQKTRDKIIKNLKYFVQIIQDFSLLLHNRVFIGVAILALTYQHS